MLLYPIYTCNNNIGYILWLVWFNHNASQFGNVLYVNATIYYFVCFVTTVFLATDFGKYLEYFSFVFTCI